MCYKVISILILGLFLNFECQKIISSASQFLKQDSSYFRKRWFFSSFNQARVSERIFKILDFLSILFQFSVWWIKKKKITSKFEFSYLYLTTFFSCFFPPTTFKKFKLNQNNFPVLDKIASQLSDIIVAFLFLNLKKSDRRYNWFYFWKNENSICYVFVNKERVLMKHAKINLLVCKKWMRFSSFFSRYII